MGGRISMVDGWIEMIREMKAEVTFLSILVWAYLSRMYSHLKRNRIGYKISGYYYQTGTRSKWNKSLTKTVTTSHHTTASLNSGIHSDISTHSHKTPIEMIQKKGKLWKIQRPFVVYIPTILRNLIKLMIS